MNKRNKKQAREFIDAHAKEKMADLMSDVEFTSEDENQPYEFNDKPGEDSISEIEEISKRGIFENYNIKVFGKAEGLKQNFVRKHTTIPDELAQSNAQKFMAQLEADKAKTEAKEDDATSTKVAELNKFLKMPEPPRQELY